MAFLQPESPNTFSTASRTQTGLTATDSSVWSPGVSLRSWLDCQNTCAGPASTSLTQRTQVAPYPLVAFMLRVREAAVLFLGLERWVVPWLRSLTALPGHLA